MKARSILFSGPMIRALLAGNKTQTRRVVKPLDKRHPIVNLKEQGHTQQYGYSGKHDDPASWGYAGAEDGCDMPLALWIDTICPYGKRGDLLWVRETWCDNEMCEAQTPERCLYRAEGEFGEQLEEHEGGRWTPSIHMPRWASRLTLRITDVRVQRLQEISRSDAIAEGVDWKTCPTRQTEQSFNAQQMARRIGMAAHYEAEILYVDGYRDLWESINGPGNWGANPWVWAITFEAIHSNVDAVLAARVSA